MPDLIGAWRRMRRVYRMYLESAFPLRSQALTAERNALFDRVGTADAAGLLDQPPLLEPVPVYQPSQYTLEKAAEELARRDPGYRGLFQLGRGLMPDGARLHEHQWQALQTVLVDKQDLVVTTGTGSGKTESFLLPLLAELARESVAWPACPELPDVDPRHWWTKADAPRVGQWEHSERPHALRAVILYPLNALVEDQLRRLRQTLDSNDVRGWLDRSRKYNRILFGRYTGQTPVPGRPLVRNDDGDLVPNTSAINRLRRALSETVQQDRDIDRQIDAAQSDEERERLTEQLRYYFPRMDGGEMWSRWDMQKTPPDILITNYSMLNIMLMRSIEAGIFEQTRDWLKGDSNRKFHLIVDELHAYRGTPGTEVAYILRLLLDRLELDINSPKLVILATSASLPEGDASRQFLREFFGRDRFQILAGSPRPPRPGARDELARFAKDFVTFHDAVQPDPETPMTAPDPDAPQYVAPMDALATALGYTGPFTEGRLRLGASLANPNNANAAEALRDACADCFSPAADGSRQVRAASVPDLDKRLFPNEPRESGGYSKAMRGLLLALGMSQANADNRASPQSVRGHLFFHNLQNLWACANPDCTAPGLDLECRQAEREAGRPVPVGALHARHALSCSSCGGRLLDLIVCEVCGEVLLGGYRKPERAAGEPEVLTCDQPNLEGIPDQIGVRKRHAEYAIFWPVNEPPHPHDKHGNTTSYTHAGVQRKWVGARLHAFSGVVRRESGPL